MNEDFLKKAAEKGWHFNKNKQSFQMFLFDTVVGEIAVKDMDRPELIEQKTEKVRKDYIQWLRKDAVEKYNSEKAYYNKIRRSFNFNKDKVVLIMTSNGEYSGIIGKIIQVKKFNNPKDPTIHGKKAYRIETDDGDSRGYFGGDDLFQLKQLDCA